MTLAIRCDSEHHAASHEARNAAFRHPSSHRRLGRRARQRQILHQLLGMRLVKKTVNQDDVSAYHLFYADGVASPGSDITFFDFPTAPRAARQPHHHPHRHARRRRGELALVAGAAQAGRRDGRRDRRARRPPDARFRGPGRPAPGAGRRRRQGRGASLGEKPGAGRAPDPRARADHHDGAGAAADRPGARPTS